MKQPLVSWGVVFPLLLACATTTRPDNAIHAYADALERGDVDTVWALLSDESKRRHSYAEVAEIIRSQPELMRERAREVRRGAKQLQEHAVVRYGEFGELRLVRRGDAWQLDTNPLDLYSQHTPRAALVGFVRAAEHRRYEILLRFSPERWQKLMSVEDLRRELEGQRADELKSLLQQLKGYMNDPILEDGNRAILRYGSNTLTFAREGSRWKIEDFD